MKTVAVVLVDRANYGRLRPVMMALRADASIRLQVVCAGTMLLDRFGRARDVVTADGFRVDSDVYLEVEGSLPITMTKSIGVAVLGFAPEFQRLAPDFVLVIGDRYEAIGAAIAAVYQNISLIHFQGGEVTGSIDESTRHAITKLAHYHFPATKRAAHYLERMGEDPATVFPLGCPSADVVAQAAQRAPQEMLERLGVGSTIDFERPYVLVLYHPVTTAYEEQEQDMTELLGAVRELQLQTVLLWPNIDAGADGVSQSIRRFREQHRTFPLHAYKNLPPEVYIPVLKHAAVALGNSSSFVRDASFVGTPVVLVGSRQDGRERSSAVVRVEAEAKQVAAAVRAQLAHGPYSPSDLYGTPGVARAIASAISGLRPYSQKRLHYAVRPQRSDD